jgi:hypothetical protein
MFQRMQVFPDGKCSITTNNAGAKPVRALRNRSYSLCLSWASDVVKNSPANDDDNNNDDDIPLSLKIFGCKILQYTFTDEAHYCCAPLRR